MNTYDIIRAWKDPSFRAQLTPEQRARLPESPAGLSMVGLEDLDLSSAVGGRPKKLWTVEGACPTAFCAPFSVIDCCDLFP